MHQRARHEIALLITCLVLAGKDMSYKGIERPSKVPGEFMGQEPSCPARLYAAEKAHWFVLIMYLNTAKRHKGEGGVKQTRDKLGYLADRDAILTVPASVSAQAPLFWLSRSDNSVLELLV